jgi:chromosome segregation ATPase
MNSHLQIKNCARYSKKSKEENLKIKSDLKSAESKIRDYEQDLLVIKKTKETAIIELHKEIEATRNDLRKVQDRYRNSLNEVSSKERTINDLKLEVEKWNLQNITINKKSRNLEDKLSLLEDQMRRTSPIIVHRQTEGDYEVPERLDAKTDGCHDDLDGIVKKYKQDFLNRKYNTTQ